MLVVDEERDFGITPGPVPVVPGDADEVVADQTDEPETVDVVDVGEPVDVGRGKRRTGREEAEVDALRRLAAVEPHESFGIVRSDGTDVHRAAVGQGDVALPSLRVRRIDAISRSVAHGPTLPGASRPTAAEPVGPPAET